MRSVLECAVGKCFAPSVTDVVVEVSTCVRCGACASVAPAVFRLTRKGIEVTAPAVPLERSPMVRAAQLICPTQAIRTVVS